MRHKILILSILLFVINCKAQLIQTNLWLMLEANRGITEASGVITNWRSYHTEENTINPNNRTNIAHQTVLAFAPQLRYINARPVVRFQWGFSTAHPTNSLFIGNDFTNILSDAITTYVVMASASSIDSAYLIYSTNWGTSLVGFFPQIGFAIRSATNSWPSSSRAVYCIGNGAGASCVMRRNNLEEQASAVGSIGIIGLQIGAGATSVRFAGDVEAILIYKELHSLAQRSQMVNWLATRYEVNMNQPTRYVGVGNSLVAGQGAIENESWTYQMAILYPEVDFYNFGVGGLQIGTNGQAGSMYVLDQARIDPVYKPGLVNWLGIDALRNDFNIGGVGATNGYARLTNYIANRTSTWSYAVNTLPDDTSNSNATWFYNMMLRTNPNPVGIYNKVPDLGSGSAYESRLANGGNATYFIDGIHLTNAGYRVMREWQQTVINAPRRGAFFN